MVSRKHVIVHFTFGALRWGSYVFECIHRHAIPGPGLLRVLPVSQVYLVFGIFPGVAMYEWYSDGLGCAQGVILSPLMFDFEFNN